MLKRRNISSEEAFQKACNENGIKINADSHTSKPFIVKRDDGYYVAATDKRVIAVKKSLNEIKQSLAANCAHCNTFVNAGKRTAVSNNNTIIYNMGKKESY